MTNMPMMQIPVPTVEELGLDQYHINGIPFDKLIAERQQLRQMIEDAEERIHDIDTEVYASLELKGVKNALWRDRWIISRRAGSMPRHTLDRTLLLNAGVTPLQLEAGTKLGKPGRNGISISDITKKRSRPQDADSDSGDFSGWPV